MTLSSYDKIVIFFCIFMLFLCFFKNFIINEFIDIYFFDAVHLSDFSFQ